MSEPKNDPLWNDESEEAPKPLTPADDVYALASEPASSEATPSGGSREAATWFAVARDGRQEGPVDLATLKSLLARNEVTSGSLVWREGMAEWLPARDIPELFPMRGKKGPSEAGSGAASAPPPPKGTSPPRRRTPPPKPPEGPLAEYEPALRRMESWLGKPAMFRWAGRGAAVLGALALAGSILLWWMGKTWFSGVVGCAILFLMGEGFALILESLARIEQQLKEGKAPPPDSEERAP